MTFFILIIVGVVIIYFVNFNNRNREEDYKYMPAYRDLDNQDKMRMDMIAGLNKLVKDTINELDMKGETPEILYFSYIISAIKSRKEFLIKNTITLSSQYKTSYSETLDIIDECCDGIAKDFINSSYDKR